MIKDFIQKNTNKKMWFLLLIILIGLFFDPINRNATKYLFLLTSTFFFIYTVYLFKKSIYRILSILLFAVTFLFIFGFEGKKIEASVLREEYVKELEKFENTTYLWGGESIFGIDCSGLVRRGVMDANLKLGIKTLNPLLIRKAISLWFYDMSADAMMNEYRHTTKYVLSAKSVNELDYSKILPGDFMLTQNGVHTMAYIGNKTWIEADPSIYKVVKVTIPEKNIMWFKVPTKIMRWEQLF